MGERIWLGMKIESNTNVLPGFMALKRSGQVVWVGRLGSPIEDAVCDGMIVSREDYDRLLPRLSPKEPQ